MKSFFTTGTGAQQTLTESETGEIPIYDDLSDAESDLANLTENQIIGTKDNSLVSTPAVDEVKAGVFNPPTSNAVSKSLSYSTTEQKTGGVWLDGKPIYRKCFICNNTISINANGWLNGVNAFSGTQETAQIIESLIDVDIMLNAAYPFIICGAIGNNPTDISLYNPLGISLPLTVDASVLIIEYTKTTD